MQSEALSPELRTSGVKQVEMMRRVERRIRPATEKVCAWTFDRETCRVQYRKITVHVKPNDGTINATADIQGNVTFYGELVRRVGSDDEIGRRDGPGDGPHAAQAQREGAAEHECTGRKQGTTTAADGRRTSSTRWRHPRPTTAGCAPRTQERGAEWRPTC